MKKHRYESEFIRKYMAQAKREFDKWHPVQGAGDPQWHKLDAGSYGNRRERARINAELRRIVLYATAIGQKRGLLPLNCFPFTASVPGFGELQDTMRVIFARDKGETEIVIELHNLTWQPTESQHELVDGAQ